MMSDRKIRDLQNQVVSMRLELTKLYGKLMEKEYHLFVKQFKNTECILPEKLENFQHWNESILEKHRATIEEIPIQVEPSIPINDIMRRVDALRKGREMLERQE